MSQRILFQFPVSHYCEKSRWQLEHKGLEFRPVNLLPGPHRLRSQWLARINTLPVLRDGRRVVGDSTRIAYYLEKHYPQQPLLPDDQEQRGRVIELEQQFDRYGVHVRRWLYGQVIDRPEVMRAMLDPYRLSSPAQAVITPLTREAVRRLYRVRPKPVMRSEQRLEEGLNLLEGELAKGDGHYLVGGRLSLADITAASLLAPLVAPPGTPWDMFAEGALSAALQKQLTALRERPAGQWVLARYAAR
ncbi:MAG: glutathione S-transferase family protein [Alcanivorax sp.]|nr:glutathione S-transferase family protein [Alcanivorax sp.]